MRKPTPEEVTNERARLKAILAIEEPNARKPNDRKLRAWKEQQERAREDLHTLDSGRWRIDDTPY